MGSVSRTLGTGWRLWSWTSGQDRTLWSMVMVIMGLYKEKMNFGVMCININLLMIKCSKYKCNCICLSIPHCIPIPRSPEKHTMVTIEALYTICKTQHASLKCRLKNVCRHIKTVQLDANWKCQLISRHFPLGRKSTLNFTSIYTNCHTIPFCRLYTWPLCIARFAQILSWG